MTHGLFINYAGVPQEISSLFPDNGLAQLAAVLLQEGHEIRILDFSTTRTINKIYTRPIRKALTKLAPKVYGDGQLSPTEMEELTAVDQQIQDSENRFLEQTVDDLIRYVDRNRVDWIGLKLWMGSIQKSMKIVQALKQARPRIKLFGGGPCADIFRQAILEEYPFIDALILSEGEEALPMLLQWIQGEIPRSEIPNLIYRDGREIVSTPRRRIQNLDHLPLPIYDPAVYPAMEGHLKMKILCYDESRGCPMGCAFCPGTSKFGTHRIEKSADRILKELTDLKQTYNVRHFRFSGSNTSVKLLKKIAEGLIQEQLDIVFAAFTSATGLDSEGVRKLVEAGLQYIFVGVESADPVQLKEMLGKGQNLDRLQKIFKACKQSDLFISTSMIHPAPFSSQHILKKNIDFLTDQFKDYEKCSVAVYPAGLYPNTRWFQNMEAYGFELTGTSKEAYIREALNYRYNIVLPRYLWKSLPYRLNGKDFYELLLDTNELAKALQENGILTYLVEANLMMAPTLGYDSYPNFANESNLAFFSGNVDQLETWNRSFNRIQAEQVCR